MPKFTDIKDKELDPRELSYRLSGKIRKIINNCLKNESDDRAEAKKKLQEIMDKEEGQKQLMSYDDLSEIHKCLQKLDNTYDIFFYQLLDETNVIIPEGSKNPELRARLSKLKCQAANKEYQEMAAEIRLVASNVGSLKPQINEVQQVRTLTTALFNGFLVVVCSFFFVYKAVEYSLPRKDIPIQVLFGIIASTIVAIAELYFFIRVM